MGYIKTEYLSKTQPLYTRVRSVKLHGLSEAQKQRAYTIAEITVKEWKKYGVLPSVAIAQAMQESTLGEYCSGNNLWGICSGAVHYDSLESGVYGYLRVINNGCYGSAPFTKDASSQIKVIKKAAVRSSAKVTATNRIGTAKVGHVVEVGRIVGKWARLKNKTASGKYKYIALSKLKEIK